MFSFVMCKKEITTLISNARDCDTLCRNILQLTSEMRAHFTAQTRRILQLIYLLIYFYFQFVDETR